MINFITMTNSGYYTFADSQIENFKKPFLQKHNLYIHCIDIESYNYHKQKDLPDNIILTHIDAEIGGQHSYLQGRFKEMMRLKFPIILNAIDSLQTAVWFIDNDVLFFKDPEEYVDLTKDILFQADCRVEVKYSWVCTGCFWINNTQKAKDLLNNIIQQSETVDRGEQQVLNDYCRSWPHEYVDGYVTPQMWGGILEFKEADLDIFPYYLFQSGHAAFQMGEYDKYDCVMIHFNHEGDYKLKVQNLIKTKQHYGV